MPSISQAQHAFMAMSRTVRGRERLKASGKTPVPMKVAADYMAADTGRKVAKLVKKKTLYFLS